MDPKKNSIFLYTLGKKILFVFCVKIVPFFFFFYVITRKK
jgi:hypothetical protein